MSFGRPPGTTILDFVDHELPRRQALHYPPVTSLVRIVVRGPRSAAVREFAAIGRGRAPAGGGASAGCHCDCWDRLVPQVPRLRGLHRMHLFVLAAEHAVLALRPARKSMRRIKPPADIQWIVDVDPQHLM